MQIINYNHDEFEIKFDFNTDILNAVRRLPNRKWIADRKIWTVVNNSQNIAALVDLAGAFDFELSESAAQLITAKKSELAEMIDYVIESGEAELCDKPKHLWYSVRGGGSMHDGKTVFKIKSYNNELNFIEYPSESNLSGSGRSGSVSYNVSEKNAFIMIREVSGSINNPDTDVIYYIIYKNDWYCTSKKIIKMLLGVSDTDNCLHNWKLISHDERKCTICGIIEVIPDL